MLPLRDEVHPEPRVGAAALLPNAVVHRRRNALRVAVGHDLEVAELGHVACEE